MARHSKNKTRKEKKYRSSSHSKDHGRSHVYQSRLKTAVNCIKLLGILVCILTVSKNLISKSSRNRANSSNLATISRSSSSAEVKTASQQSSGESSSSNSAASETSSETAASTSGTSTVPPDDTTTTPTTAPLDASSSLSSTTASEGTNEEPPQESIRDNNNLSKDNSENPSNDDNNSNNNPQDATEPPPTSSTLTTTKKKKTIVKPHARENHGGGHAKTYTIPETVDMIPEWRVKNAFPAIANDPTRIQIFGDETTPGLYPGCKITSQFQLSRQDMIKVERLPKRHRTWTLATYDIDGNAKTVGGDEIYVTFTPTGWNYPLAMAEVTDLKNGNYSLAFTSSSTLTDDEYHSAPTMGSLAIMLEQSCGIGELPPPTKGHWKTSGAINQRYIVKEIPRPQYIQKFVRANSVGTKINFHHYDQVVVTGDSLMGQFVCAEHDQCDRTAFHDNVYFAGAQQTPLNLATLDAYWHGKTRRDMQRALADITSKRHPKMGSRGVYRDASGKLNYQSVPIEKYKIAWVIGSGVWDLLEDGNGGDGNAGADFEDHIEACRQLMDSLQAGYPTVDFYWKGMTAVHLHAVAAMPNWPEIKRVYYMSNARAKRLDELQKQTMKKLGIPVLDVFPATYFGSHQTRYGDGRHYTAEFNAMVNGWFYGEGNTNNNNPLTLEEDDDDAVEEEQQQEEEEDNSQRRDEEEKMTEETMEGDAFDELTGTDTASTENQVVNVDVQAKQTVKRKEIILG